MSRPPAANRVLAAAVRDVEKLEKRALAKGAGGIPLTELLGRVNRATVKFLPKDGRDSRVSRVFTPRSFRHYQTLGCIDAPQREGKSVVYGVRHFLQALLVRKLLWERVPAERIAGLMIGRSTEETKGMLFDGIEIVVRQGAGEGEVVGAIGPDAVESWKRIGVAPGVELHLSSDLPKPRPAALKKVLGQLETALRRNL